MRNSSGRSNQKSRHYKANNQGGFGNPPIRHQFKQGAIGGPGRPKGQTSLESAMKKMFRGKVTVVKNGETTETAVAEALAERTKKEMLAGSAKSLEIGLELADKYGPRDEVDEIPVFDLSFLSIEQKRALRDLLKDAEFVDRQELRRLQQFEQRFRDQSIEDETNSNRPSS